MESDKDERRKLSTKLVKWLVQAQKRHLLKRQIHKQVHRYFKTKTDNRRYNVWRGYDPLTKTHLFSKPSWL